MRPQPILRTERGDTNATGQATASGFLVFAGAEGRAATVTSFPEHLVRMRDKLLSQGILTLVGDRLRLTQDHEFNSPSTAASVLMGGSVNGRFEWKRAGAMSLGEWEDLMASNEVTFRRRWYEAHRARFLATSGAVADSERVAAEFAASATEPLRLLGDLARTNDTEGFRAGLQTWAVLPTTLAFNGFSGQMLLNQLVKRSPDQDALARLLVDVLAVPESEFDARDKLGRFVAFIESVRVGAHPAPGHALFFASYFWALADHSRWATFWASAVSFVEYLTGDAGPDELPDRYLWYLQTIEQVEADIPEFERVAIRWHDTKLVLVDPVLMDRCEYGMDSKARSHEELETNAKALNAITKHIGSAQLDAVSATLGREVKSRIPPLDWKNGRPRSDSWVSWSTDEWQMGLRLWVTRHGVAVGLTPGMPHTGWLDQAAKIIEASPVTGMRMMASRQSKHGDDVGVVGGEIGSFIYGRWYESAELADLDLEAAIADAAVSLQPAFHRLRTEAGGQLPPDEDDPLASFVERFLADRGYPTPADEDNRADRRHFAELLDPERIRTVDVRDLRIIWNTGRYGGPGPMSALNTTVRDADAAEYDRIIDSLVYLCWGEDPDEVRIDNLLSDDAYNVRGLGESVIAKMLAICHPDRYIPAFPYTGPRGKLKLLRTLGLDEPTGTRGQLQVESNRLLHDRLEAFFPNDPWGMTKFLYWYDQLDEEETEERDVIGELAGELFVDREFIEEIVELLEDKGQVVFYGPPGTGKTYLARKLAEALAPEKNRRSLVQFHPSSSYEDFFEGYRPESSGDGDLSYRLTPGPLALLAEQAAESPGKRHIMIIDEINRANLPKVFGELLFLLEYRGESVQTLYRPEAPFELPPKDDLWFIGTMNTADRSIALIDAAMRRRFNFVPFFPNSGGMSTLLEKWLAAKDPEHGWVAEFLLQVNQELEEALGGPHLQIGPSHFMVDDLSKDRVRKIWRANVEPFIEDQFFGDRAQISRFRFDAVYARYADASGIEELEELQLAAEEAAQEDAERPLWVEEDSAE